MTFPKKLEAMKSHTIALYKITHDQNNNPQVFSKWCYESGMLDAYYILLPEIEKLREALEWYATKGEGVYSDAKLYLRAEKTLQSWQKFLGEKSEGGDE